MIIDSIVMQVSPNDGGAWSDALPAITLEGVRYKAKGAGMTESGHLVVAFVATEEDPDRERAKQAMLEADQRRDYVEL